jgi:uncharacterized membrane protein YcaP (DUF421 family)
LESVVHAAVIYLYVMFVFRLAGKRTLAQATSFDLALLLIISEATQNVLIGEDRSLTGAILVIGTIVGLDVAFTMLKWHAPRVERFLDGVPTILLEHGRPIEARLRRERVDANDILAAARQAHGLERLEQIKYAILEPSGQISIIPREADR